MVNDTQERPLIAIMLQAVLDRSVQISPGFYKVKTCLPSGLAALMLAGLNYIAYIFTWDILLIILIVGIPARRGPREILYILYIVSIFQSGKKSRISHL